MITARSPRDAHPDTRLPWSICFPLIAALAVGAWLLTGAVVVLIVAYL